MDKPYTEEFEKECDTLLLIKVGIRKTDDGLMLDIRSDYSMEVNKDRSRDLEDIVDVLVGQAIIGGIGELIHDSTNDDIARLIGKYGDLLAENMHNDAS